MDFNRNLCIIDKLTPEFENSLFPVFQNSCIWFNVFPGTPEIDPSKFMIWSSKIVEKEGQVIFSKNSHNVMLGFIFVYTKDSQSKSKHIWLAACNPSYLRNGVMMQLFDHIESSVRPHCTTLTVNTYPSKFPYMYLFLEKRNYSLVDKVSKESDHDGVKYCYSKMLL